MNISDFFPKGNTKKLGVNQSYGLTPLGKTKAEEFALSGPKWTVLAVLNENGPSSVSEIATEAHLSPDKVKSILRTLISSGYVQRVSHDG